MWICGARHHLEHPLSQRPIHPYFINRFNKSTSRLVFSRNSREVEYRNTQKSISHPSHTLPDMHTLPDIEEYNICSINIKVFKSPNRSNIIFAEITWLQNNVYIKRIFYDSTSQLFLENTIREDKYRNTEESISYRYEVISRYVRNRGI